MLAKTPFLPVHVNAYRHARRCCKHEYAVMEPGCPIDTATKPSETAQRHISSTSPVDNCDKGINSGNRAPPPW